MNQHVENALFDTFYDINTTAGHVKIHVINRVRRWGSSVSPEGVVVFLVSIEQEDQSLLESAPMTVNGDFNGVC